MSHTPGPWTLGKHGAILGAEGRPAFNGTAYPQVALATLDERSDDEREANARLIAAAPELLEAAINIRAFFASNYFGPMLETRCAEIDAAIEKATGGGK